MLAVSLDVAFSASTALAHLATLPDTWIHSGSCFQVDWCNIDVPVPATGNPLENKFTCPPLAADSGAEDPSQ
jgi:hypothetical protein